MSLVLIGRPDLAAAPTLTPLRVAEDEAALKAEAARFSGRVELLADGSVVASFAGDGVASDLAARAVRCALALRALLPDRSAVVATGHAALGHGLPVGDVIDRAARLLRAPAATTIELDEVTRSLVGSRFDVREGAFVGERNEADGGSTVLGRAVPFVGREREIAALTGLLDECVGEPIARAAVVVAAPGAGKSRLVAEVTRAIRTRWPAAQVWTGRGDATTTDSPLSVLRDALRRSDGRFRDLLLAPVEAATAEVRAARGDAHALSEQMRRAFQECVQGACRAAPLVLVLEDLQWSDGASVDFVHSTLKVAAKEPFMVLATGRPELWARFPKLWEEALAMRVDLTPLSKKSSEKLARAMLPEASADVVARLARQSEGNPLFLEEVARAEAEGRARAIPGSVVAMVHARIERLAPKLRLVLRAASVFGRTFWRGGVRELVGDEIDAQEIDRCLDELVRRELVLEVDECAFAGDRQYVFHQDLTREAAYRTLTDEDRALGHKLAGDWLEGAGETNALVLAAHFEKGHELARAVGAYHAAATQALEAEDLEAALDLADKGIASGATGEARGMLRLLQGECHWWRGTDARAALTSAIAELPRRSPSWARAVVRLAMHEGRNDAVDAIATMARDLVAASALLDATWGGALLMLAVQLLVVAPGDAAELAACAIELSTDARKNPRDAFDASRPLAEGDIETLVRLGWAEALDENGDRDAARAVIEAARHRVLERAAEIRDELLRERFLLTPENARTLELAKAWASPE
ncbi:MAG TPA: AAA family ATPase [Polyangiaceae bacterium]|nr:AAA family ATPase [Polyangiaceae bacterium]